MNILDQLAGAGNAVQQTTANIQEVNDNIQFVVRHKWDFVIGFFIVIVLACITANLITKK